MNHKPKWGSAGGAWSVRAAVVPDAVDVLAIRRAQRSGYHQLSQEAFAKRFGFTGAAVREWEQGRRKPGRTARVLLTLIDREPEAVARALTAPPPSRPAKPR